MKMKRAAPSSSLHASDLKFQDHLIFAIRPLPDRLQSHARFWASSSLLRKIPHAANE